MVSSVCAVVDTQGIMVQLKATSAEEMLQPELQLAANEVPLRGGEQGWSYPRVVYAFNRRDPVATERALAFTGALKQLVRVILNSSHCPPPSPLPPPKHTHLSVPHNLQPVT